MTEERRYTEAELAACLREALDDPAALARLEARAVAVRDEALGDRREVEAAFNSLVPCRLAPLCRYCGYWREGRGEPFETAEVLDAVRLLRDETDIRQFHLSGGTGLPGEANPLVDLVEAIRAAGFDEMGVVVNCGANFSDEELGRLASLEVKRVFSVFETLDPELFAATKPGDDLAAKQELARRVAAAGMGVGTGLMVGLDAGAGRFEGYARSLAYLASMEGLECLYVSKFRPVRGTPLEQQRACPEDEARALVALARLVLPEVHLRAAAGWSAAERARAEEAGAGFITIGRSFSKGRTCFD